jgi:hypothetical protein
MFKLCGSLIALAVVTANAGAADLFNGRDFAGWELVTTPAASMADVFTVRPDGVIASTGKPAGFIATVASYRNYRLHVEWRWSGKPGNAGVLLHISPGPMDRVWPLSLQVQTKRGNAGDLLPMAGASFAEPLTSAAGAPVAIKARMAADSENPPGEWNSCDIVARDGAVEVRINGVVQNTASKVEPSFGRIGFQLEGAAYELRRVTLEPLAPPD